MKNKPLPSHSWLFFNKLTNYFAVAFLLLAFVIFLVLWTISYTIRRDCYNPYDRSFEIGNYWIGVKAGSLKDGCPVNEEK